MIADRPATAALHTFFEARQRLLRRLSFAAVVELVKLPHSSINYSSRLEALTCVETLTT